MVYIKSIVFCLVSFKSQKMSYLYLEMISRRKMGRLEFGAAEAFVTYIRKILSKNSNFQFGSCGEETSSIGA